MDGGRESKMVGIKQLSARTDGGRESKMVGIKATLSQDGWMEGKLKSL